MKVRHHLYTTLDAPEKAENIPENSHWLAGEGAGSWFYIEQAENNYKVTRYSSAGKIECSGLFNLAGKTDFNINAPFEFVHLCHCKSVTIRQKDQILKFDRIS
jgi:hypothetical protein